MPLLELEVVKVFLLVMVRFSGLLIAAPVWGSPNFPVRAKIGLAFFFGLLMTPLIPALAQTLPGEPIAFAMIALGELAIGLMIGFVMSLIFAAVQVAGQIMDMQTGFGMMNVFNPALETQFPIFGFFYFILAILYLLVLDLHLVMIRALAATFDAIPLGGVVVRPELLWEVSRWGSAMFYNGLLIAAPVAAALLLAYATMGLLGRVVPQIHLFAVGFPITIAIGLLVAALTATHTLYFAVVGRLFDEMWEDVATVVRGLTP
jgi:flagellar biosynthesis protein FliR